MALNNYLGKIFFLYLSQCELGLHCVVSLWAIDTGGLSFVQVMLIFAGHSPGVCLPRQVGQWVRKSSSQQSLTQWPAAWIYRAKWLFTDIACFLKNVLCLLRTSEGKKKTTGQEEQPKYNSRRQTELCASTETKYLKPTKAVGFYAMCALSLLDPLNVMYCGNRTRSGNVTNIKELLYWVGLF